MSEAFIPMRLEWEAKIEDVIIDMNRYGQSVKKTEAVDYQPAMDAFSSLFDELEKATVKEGQK